MRLFTGFIARDRAKQQRKRAERKARMPSTSLDMAHTEGSCLLPDRLALLDRMPKNARVAEIGVAFADFSREIFARAEPAVLHLVDAWEMERYRDGFEATQTLLADEIAAGRVVIQRGLSTDVLGSFAPGSLDWVYIDTNHRYGNTKAELELCNGLVARDGRIAGHDFCSGNVINGFPYGVVEAVTEFCKTHGWRFEYLTLESDGHFSYCLRRLASGASS